MLIKKEAHDVKQEPISNGLLCKVKGKRRVKRKKSESRLLFSIFPLFQTIVDYMSPSEFHLFSVKLTAFFQVVDFTFLKRYTLFED